MLLQTSAFKELFSRIEKTVFIDREEKAIAQKEENEQILKSNPNAKVNKHHINFFNKWWQLSYSREDMLIEIEKINKYIVCAQVTRRPIFEFISKDINPNAALMVFAFEDDYSFGIINSKYHWEWFKEKCSTLEERLRYTTDSVWDTFPWPQSPSAIQIEEVAKASKALRDGRNRIMAENKMSLRDLYRLLEKPGKNPVRDLQNALDRAVTEAYGFDERADLLEQLLNLNHQIACREQKGEPVVAPGLPEWFKNEEKLISDDCVRFEG